jgi:hypothetical protein
MCYGSEDLYWNPLTGKAEADPPVISREQWVNDVYERASGNACWWRIVTSYIPRLGDLIAGWPEVETCWIDGTREEVWDIGLTDCGDLAWITIWGRDYGPLGFLRKYLRMGTRPLAAEIRDLLDKWDEESARKTLQGPTTYQPARTQPVAQTRHEEWQPIPGFLNLTVEDLMPKDDEWNGKYNE